MMDNNPEIEVARAIGAGPLRFFSRIHYGGGAACAVVMQAALAVGSGAADVVVCYRAMNERSQQRFGIGTTPTARVATTETAHFGWYAPFGLLTPASWVAMQGQRYLHDYGATTEDFGRVSVACRRHAATNPRRGSTASRSRSPTTRRRAGSSGRFASSTAARRATGRSRSSSTTLERARDAKQPPAVIRAAAQGASRDQQMMTSYYRDAIGDLPEMADVARELYAQSGLGPKDFQTAVIYDHFTPFVLAQLEAFGFCGRGEAQGLHPRRPRSRSVARLPINTHGGQLGEAYIHGMNGVAEGVRQVRGTAVNQVRGVEHVLVTAGTGVPTSAIILGKI